MDFVDVVTVSQTTKQAIILPTKTRPKKIAFLGSNGKELVLVIRFEFPKWL